MLQALADQFGLPAPTLATLKTLYRSSKSSRPGESTIYEHQPWVFKKAGFKEPGKKHLGRLKSHMLKQARYKGDVDLLVESGKVWMYQRSLLLTMGDRAIRDLAREANTATRAGLYSLIMAAVTPEQLEKWEQRILATRPDLGTTWMEWLSTAPRKLSLRAIKERIDRIDFLKDLGVDAMQLEDVPLEKIRLYANEIGRAHV